MYFPIDVQEIRRPSRIYKLSVKCFTTIRDIKVLLQEHVQFPLNRMQFFHSSRSEALGNQTTLHELGIDREGFLLTVSLIVNSNPHYLLEPLKLGNLDSKCKEMVEQVKEGLMSGQGLSKTDLLDCTGGVYFLKNENSNIAVFKPHDEEQGMPNNPKGYAGNGKTGLREQFTPGEGYLREVSAYLLDEQNFVGVPATCLAHCEHPAFHYPTQSSGTRLYPKLGSLQEFVNAGDTFEDISYSLIGTLELQKIALFDMRTLNCDRNSANILAIRKPFSQMQMTRPRRDSRSGSMGTSDNEFEEMDMGEWMDRPLKKNNSSRNDDCYQLVPIDHGYCLPPKLMIEEFDWCWFNCPQIAQPVDPEIKRYMNEINIEQIIEKIKKQLGPSNQLPEDCFFLLRLTHNLIRQGINQGMTLRDIAGLIARTEDGVASALEKAVKTAEDNAQRAVAAHGGGFGYLSTPLSPPRRMKSPSCVTSIVHNVLPNSMSSQTTSSAGSVRSSFMLSPIAISRETSATLPGVDTCPSLNSLRPRGPLAYLSSLEPSPTSSCPPSNLNSNHNSFFVRNTSPSASEQNEFTESSSDSSSELLIQSIAQLNKDNEDNGFCSSNDESYMPNTDNELLSLPVDLEEECCEEERNNLPVSSKENGQGVRRVSSFSLLEVATTEPMVFEKTIPQPVRQNHSSGCTSEEEDEQEGFESISPVAELLSEMPTFNSTLPPSSSLGVGGLGLTRVVSFNAFESPALYENEKNDRFFNRLKREKRKLSVKSPEFQELRMNFANEAVIKTIATHFKVK